MKFRAVSFLFICFFVFILKAQQAPIPKVIGLVNDYAGVLAANEVDELTSKLLIYEDSTSTQITVVIEKNLQGREAADRALLFARTWGVGQKDKNNGIVIYLATEDRKYFILNANKTQGKLTDGVTGEIGRTLLVPYLKQNPPNYYSGLSATILGLQKALKGEFNANPKSEKGFPLWAILLVMVILILLFSKSNGGGPQRGYRNSGSYWFPVGGFNGGGFNGGGGGSSSSWGGFGGGGGFDGGGAGGSW